MMDAEVSKSGAGGEGLSKSARRRRRKNKKKAEGQEDGVDIASPTSPTQPQLPHSHPLHNGQQTATGICHNHQKKEVSQEKKEVPQEKKEIPQEKKEVHQEKPPEAQSLHSREGKHRQRHRNHKGAENVSGAAAAAALDKSQDDAATPETPVESGKMERRSPSDVTRAAGHVSEVGKKESDSRRPQTAAETEGAKMESREKEGEKKEIKGGESAGDGEAKSKAQLRAERRAKQEAQRAAKAERMGGKPANKAPVGKDGEAAGKVKQAAANANAQKPNEGKKKEEKKEASARRKSEAEESGRPVSSTGHADEMMRVPAELRHDDPQQVKKKIKRLEKQNLVQRPETHKKVSLFSHLPQYRIEDGVLPDTWKAGNVSVHSAFYRVGVQMAYGSIRGANHRCLALAEALSTFIDSYNRTEDKEFARHFESVFSPNITFVSQCRPLTAGMRSFVKHFKAEVVSVGRKEDLTDDEKKKELKDMVYNFIREKIILAGETIAENASEKITDKSCLLTYAYSSTVCGVFAHAKKQGTNFTVIVADSEPLFEGRRMIKFLEKHGIDCEYVSLTGVYSIMNRVTSVFIGAQALFNNGSVLSRAGTGFVACIAEQFNCLVHVCCESYKFWERVQLDSFVYNDLSDPGVLIEDSKMREEWENPKSPLHYVNPQYDVTPPELIDVVITELCLMPGSSVPVVLRRNAV